MDSRLAQLAERWTFNPLVAGSIPVPGVVCFFACRRFGKVPETSLFVAKWWLFSQAKHSRLAQLAERWALNPLVAGSIPVPGVVFFACLRFWCKKFC